MSGLDFAKPDLSADSWNAILYGPGGNGKTVGACSAPGPVVLVNADGPDASRKSHAIYGDKIREVPFEGAATLRDVFTYVQTDGKDTKTVVLDPLGEIYQKLFEEIHPPGAARKDGLAAHGDVQTMIERFVRSFRDLPVNLVIVCHEQIEGEGENAISRPMTGGKKLPEKIVGMVSIVGYCGVAPADPEKGTPRRWVAQLVEGRGRRAKDRSEGLGDSRDIDLTEWFATATAAMNDTQTQTSLDKSGDAETKEQVAE